MNDLSKLLLEAADLLSEGAAKTNRNPERKLDKYFSKYAHEGDKKSGTITVDGKKIEIDKNIKSNTAKLSDGSIVVRQTGIDSTSKNPRLIIGKDFVNLKNNKRRDASLYHEIGHMKFYNKSANGERKENIDKLKKYEIPNTHANVDEFEADIYSSQQKNGNHLKRSTRNMYKYYSSERGINNNINGSKKITENIYGKGSFIPFSKEYIKKSQNISAQDDMNQRAKALKDKSINKKVYRESIDLLLCEAINLLERE